LRNPTALSPASQPNEQNGAVIDHLIALSGAKPIDRITVAGREALDVFVGLYRRGFLHCACRVLGAVPCVANDSSDSLWILETQDAAELRTLLAGCGRDLRSDGTLLVGFDTHGPADKPARLGEVLIKCGFLPIKEAHSAGRGFLVCTRKKAAVHVLAA
jgi:hypothetical protein